MKFKILLLFVFVSAITYAQNGEIQVEITNIKSNSGNIGVALYNNPGDFTKKEFKAQNVKAVKGKVFAAFTDIPSGNYAVAILHDENKNQKMDFNLVGIPKEAYGFSNNAKAVLAPPKFKDAAFTLKAGEIKKISVKL